MYQYQITVPEIKEDGNLVVYNNNLTWKNNPPTQEGWYWARESIVNAVVIVRVNPDLRVSDVFEIRVRMLSEYTHWLGPLPVPEVPKE